MRYMDEISFFCMWIGSFVPLLKRFYPNDFFEMYVKNGVTTALLDSFLSLVFYPMTLHVCFYASTMLPLLPWLWFFRVFCISFEF